ncbi:hypothetical protein LB823_06615 [Tsukamurella sp. M9C]|uniref:hypothetical protein n=1 Tax=Tsukamurella sp. M9C TaxID=2877520 RepID=UPI001CCD6579|nr:hypothetical protein [Tsukamurella sp. M9C]MCA0155865.1 hypothetical protein [Tsukamurella sp. M9C]
MRWDVRRWVSRVLLALASLTALATMGIVVDEDDLGGSLFLVGVVLFVAATVLHCRRPSRLSALAICYAAGLALILLVILLAVTIGPHHAGTGGHWGWRDAAVGIGMSCLMALATLIWCLGTDPPGRALRRAAIPLIAGIAASAVPVPVIHDRAAAVAMVAALVGVVLCEVRPVAEESEAP